MVRTPLHSRFLITLAYDYMCSVGKFKWNPTYQVVCQVQCGIRFIDFEIPIVTNKVHSILCWEIQIEPIRLQGRLVLFWKSQRQPDQSLLEIVNIIHRSPGSFWFCLEIQTEKKNRNRVSLCWKFQMEPILFYDQFGLTR